MMLTCFHQSSLYLTETNNPCEPSPYFAELLTLRAGVSCRPCPHSAWFPAAQTAPRTWAFISTAAAHQVRAEQIQSRNTGNETQVFLSHSEAQQLRLCKDETKQRIHLFPPLWGQNKAKSSLNRMTEPPLFCPNMPSFLVVKLCRGSIL